MPSDAVSQPKQVVYFSYPRAACHLLEKMLSKQPHTRLGWHPLVRARPAQVPLFLTNSIEAGMPEDLRKAYQAQVDAGIAEWEEALKSANAAGDTYLMHGHPHFAMDPDYGLSYVTKGWKTQKPTDDFAHNFTLIPERLLLAPGTTVLLNFRHPALGVPAAYEAMTAHEKSMDTYNFRLSSHLGWQRRMYDWYVSHGITPVLLETEDMMSSREIVRKAAKELGLSPEHCIFEWPKATEAETAQMHPMYVLLQSTLLNSTGVVEKKIIKNVDIDEEERKWRERWGDEVADFLRETTDSSMLHYEYLKAKKLRL